MGGQAAAAGVWALVIGLVLIVGRTARADALSLDPGRAVAEAPGPGGGEPTDQPLEPRFRRTDERFVDPTTRLPMRVWLDPETGERRYRAED